MELIQLQQAIERHPQQDTIRVNLLNALGNSRSLQGDEIEKVAGEALVISRKTGYVKGEAYALLNMSVAKLQLGNRQEAVQLVHRADSIAKQTGDQALMAYVLIGIGKVQSSKTICKHIIQGTKSTNRKSTRPDQQSPGRVTANAGATHSIRKNGFIRRAYCGYCT